MIAEASEHGFTSALAAAAWIKQQFGIEYKPSGIHTWFARKHIAKKVPRPMNARATDEAQLAYKKGH